MSDISICDKCGVQVAGFDSVEAKLDYGHYKFCQACFQGMRKEWERMRREAYRLAGERMAAGR